MLEAFINIPGDYLLSHASLPRSTIGATGLNFRVRDGIGCNSCAMITGENFRELMQIFNRSKKIDKAFRPISTSQLHMLPCFHFQPIKQVIFLRPWGTIRSGRSLSEPASRLDAFSGYPFQT